MLTRLCLACTSEASYVTPIAFLSLLVILIALGVVISRRNGRVKELYDKYEDSITKFRDQATMILVTVQVSNGEPQIQPLNPDSKS